MAALVRDLRIQFVGPSLSREGLAELKAIRAEARVAARRALVRVRRVTRDAAPKRTAKMVRSFQVRALPRVGRFGAGARLSSGRRVFYASFTQTENARTIGWFDRTTEDALNQEVAGELGIAVNGLGRRYAALVARDIIKQFLGRTLTGALRITRAGFFIRPVPIGGASAGIVRFNIGGDE